MATVFFNLYYCVVSWFSTLLTLVQWPLTYELWPRTCCRRSMPRLPLWTPCSRRNLDRWTARPRRSTTLVTTSLRFGACRRPAPPSRRRRTPIYHVLSGLTAHRWYSSSESLETYWFSWWCRGSTWEARRRRSIFVGWRQPTYALSSPVWSRSGLSGTSAPTSPSRNYIRLRASWRSWRSSRSVTLRSGSASRSPSIVSSPSVSRSTEDEFALVARERRTALSPWQRLPPLPRTSTFCGRAVKPRCPSWQAQHYWTIRAAIGRQRRWSRRRTVPNCTFISRTLCDRGSR